MSSNTLIVSSYYYHLQNADDFFYLSMSERFNLFNIFGNLLPFLVLIVFYLQKQAPKEYRSGIFLSKPN